MGGINIHHKDEGAILFLGRELFRMIVDSKKNYQEIKFICIGTDRIIGDSFGPFVGSLIKKDIKNRYQIFGDLECNVNALNVERINEENKKDSLIIAIDAATTRNIGSIGNISISSESLRPGSGVGKEISPVGDISIRGIIGLNRTGLSFDLNLISLNMVYEMAQIASSSIYYALKQYESYNSALLQY